MTRVNVASFGLRSMTPGAEEAARPRLKRVLSTLDASTYITDYAPGWGRFSLDMSVSLGIPLVGAAPFPSPYMGEFRKRARSSVVFNDTMDEFFANPDPYFEWLKANAHVLLLYFPPNDSSYIHRRVLDLGLDIHNMYNIH